MEVKSNKGESAFIKIGLVGSANSVFRYRYRKNVSTKVPIKSEGNRIHWV